MTLALKPKRGGFLRPFGCGEFIRKFLLGHGPNGSSVIDPCVGAPQADIFHHYKMALMRATALDRAVEAMGVDKGAIWIGRRHATSNVVVAAGHRGTRQVRALTAPLAGTRAVEDWRAVENGAQLQAASLMADHEIRASLSTPITDDQQPIGGLLLAFSDVRSWSPEEVALIEVLGRQLAEAARRLQLQERSRKQAQQMEQILHSVPGGMLLLDAEKRVAVANPAAWNYLMVLADGSIGGTLIQLGNRPIGELLAPPAEGLWHEIVLREPEHWVFEVVARPVDEGTETEGWVLMIRDVTQEREIQKRTQQQEQLATVGQMAAGIAHDFNNILAVITLYAQILLRKPDLGPDIKDNLDTIHQQTIRAAELIQQILDFSRSAVLRPQALNLVPLLKEQVKLLSRTLPANIQLNVTYDSEKHLVHADPARMQQMVMNLALNARDAMPEGGTIEIGLAQLRIRMGERIPLPEMRSGDWAKVTVSDSGTGIPAEIEQHIFEPFFTTKAPGKGTGLGLSQVYGIVKQHGGHIDMSTKPGVGTTFTLYLPALPVEAAPEASPITTVLDHGAAETILVVEDNTVTRTAIVESLKVLNYQVLEAGDGLEALKVLEAGAAVQLVLTDLVMPKMGGRELIQVLRKRDAPVKIVAMTAHPLDDYMDELRAMGVVDWLHKPPSLKTLAQVIARALERQE